MCGAVRYRIEGAVLWAGICHCKSCRRATGAQSVGWASVEKAQLTVTKLLAVFTSSPGISRGFCPACGTSITYDEGNATIDVTLASLDNPEAVVPTHEAWLEHRLSWAAVDAARELRPRGND